MDIPQLLIAHSRVCEELACYKAEYGELAGKTEYRCAFCPRSVFGPPVLDPQLGPPVHSECFLKQQLAEREKEVLALRSQLGIAERKSEPGA